MASSTDRIEKRILLRAPRARVWRALADVGEFGRWFEEGWTIQAKNIERHVGTAT